MKSFRLAYANSLDAFIPEIWANESILLLRENIVAASLIHRDFQNEIAKFGDVVNTRKPTAFTAKRKTNTDDVTVQDAVATNIPVTLNQHIHTSFMIRDGEESKSFLQLRNEYLLPAVQSLATAIDQIVLGQVYQFLGNAEGGVGALTDSTVKGYMLDTRKRMNINKAYEAGRNMIMTPNTDAEALKLDWFVNADKVGDNGTALREASLGRKFQFDNFMCQNTPSITNSLALTGVAVDLTAGYAVGAVAMHMDGTGGAKGGRDIAVGNWFFVGTDLIPHQVTATANLSTDDVDVTFTPGLKRAVATDIAVTFFKNADINLGAGYLIGYSKEIVVHGITGAIEVGSMVSFATAGTPNVLQTGSPKYCVIAVTNSGGNTIGITLDRPLDVALADTDIVNVGPQGDYNFAFHKNALALVVRPLAAAPAGLAISSTQQADGIAIRVTVTYDGVKQGVLVTVDLLCGIAVLDTALGAVMLG